VHTVFRLEYLGFGLVALARGDGVGLTVGKEVAPGEDDTDGGFDGFFDFDGLKEIDGGFDGGFDGEAEEHRRN